MTHFDHAGKNFNMIDCPGYPDLIGQTVGALRAVDTALVAIDAHAGIKVNTRRVWQEAEKAGVGKVIVITKLDADNINFEELLANIKEVFGNGCVPVNVPVGLGTDFKGVVSTLQVPDDTSGAVLDPAEISESLVESIIEVDEAVMEKYFEGEMPTKEQLAALMVRAIGEGTLVPILCLSTKGGGGVDELLDFLAGSALPPTAVVRKATVDGDEVTLKPDPSAALAGQVFKTRIDPFVQKLSFIRIYSGTLSKDSTIPASSSRKGIKVSQLLKVQANETQDDRQCWSW